MTMHNPDWPITGFTYTDEDDVEEFVYFHILEAGGNSGQYPNWTIRENVVETHIPGTNVTYVESMGFYPATVTHLLSFDNRDDYYQLLTFHGQIGTLRVIYGTQNVRGEVLPDHLSGIDYELLDNTRIADFGVATHYANGVVECEVSFSRAIDPVTRLAAVL